ncbi:MAG: hypothetical protein AAFP90_18645, partial [Planctomycetota bacterium]
MTNASTANTRSEADRTAEMLCRAREIREQLPTLNDEKDKRRLQTELNDLQNQLLEIVDRHARCRIRSSLAQQFPNKGVVAPPKRRDAVHSSDAVVRYTELVNEFFAEVLAKPHLAFWRAQSLDDLRKIMTRAIKNHIRDAIKHRNVKRRHAGDLLRYQHQIKR